MLFDDKVSAEFAAKVKAIASRLGMVADYIMAVIGFESRMTFSPSEKNPLSSATGLIQFMSSTAAGMGTTTAALAAMTAVQQLDYVERYFSDQIKAHGSLKTLEDTYLAVFYPAAIGKPLSYAFSDSVRSVNPAFVNKATGEMTKADIVTTITAWVTAKGGVITQYNDVYKMVTVVGIAVMLSWWGLKTYYPHILK